MTEAGSPLEGTSFGPYRLLRRIGGGGLGDVYVAERVEPGAPSAGPDTSLAGPPAGRPVAIKVLRPPASDSLARTTLADSARAHALRAAHIIPVYDPALQGDRAGVVMAYAPGGSLADALARRGSSGQPIIALPMRPAVVARIIMQIGHALADAHAAGLAHGDVKPSNIFIRRSSRGGLLAALSDFGQGAMVTVARQLIAASSPMADEPWIAGQLLFSAPERLAGVAPDPASDQYSLAAVAYYLLTGRPPVAGDARALLAAIPTAQVIELSALLPDAPAGLDEVLLRALAADPARRYPSVEVFARALGATLASAADAQSVTQEFSRLSGQRATSAPPEGGSSRRAPVTSAGLPGEPPSALWRALALATAAAALIALATCGVSLFALNSTGIHPRALLPSFQGPNAMATQGHQPPSAQEKAANDRLRALVAQQPLFTDNLSTNQQTWRISGGQARFTPNGLDFTSQNVAAPAFADAPKVPGQPGYAGQVTIKFQSGATGDLAGVRFYVTDDGSGGQEYYSLFLSPNGEYYFWYYHNAWNYLSGGYAAPVKPGVGVANTISFVTDSAQGAVTLYANGSYVDTVPLISGGPTGGGSGVIILSGGLEATFSNFALYPGPR